MSHGSPVPAHTVSWAEGATASAPMAVTSLSSKIGAQLMPLSVVFQMPPSAAPIYTVYGSPGTPVIEATRLPSGPTNRKWRAPSPLAPPSVAAPPRPRPPRWAAAGNALILARTTIVAMYEVRRVIPCSGCGCYDLVLEVSVLASVPCSSRIRMFKPRARRTARDRRNYFYAHPVHSARRPRARASFPCSLYAP